MNISAIILAAGKGKRMNSDTPKVLHELNNKTLIEYVIDATKEAGIDSVNVIVKHKKALIIDKLQNRTCNFIEQDENEGTGAAVLSAKELFKDFDGKIVVLSGDVPLITPNTIKSLIALHESKNVTATILTAVLDNPFGYGRIIRNEEGLIDTIIEEKDASESEKKINEINAGTYCFESKSLFQALDCISSDNAQGEYYLTDVIKIFENEGKIIAGMKVQDTKEIMGINTVEDKQNIERLLSL